MNVLLEQVLERVTQETLMNLAFLLPTEDGPVESTGACASAVPDPLTVTVGFDGPKKGYIRLVVAGRLVSPLATNMLGLEFGDSPSEAQQTDALKEMGNVVCGNLLPAVDAPESVFNVLAPEVRPGLVPASGDPVAQALLRLEEGELAVELYME